jgi:hypothetical protein
VHTGVMIACGWISIGLYAVVLIAMRLRSAHTAMEGVHAVQMKREAKITKTLALVMVTTLFLQILPVTILSSDLGNTQFITVIGPYLWTVTAVNSGLNAFIYAGKNQQLRQAMRKTFCRQSSVGVGAAGGNAARLRRQ